MHPGRHVITVTYTIDDDGIHLICKCGWTKCLGYEPTVEAVTAARDEHIQQIDREYAEAIKGKPFAVTDPDTGVGG